MAATGPTPRLANVVEVAAAAVVVHSDTHGGWETEWPRELRNHLQATHIHHHMEAVAEDANATTVGAVIAAAAAGLGALVSMSLDYYYGCCYCCW